MLLLIDFPLDFNATKRLHCGRAKTFLSSRKILSIVIIWYNYWLQYVVKWSHCEFKRDLLYFFNIATMIYCNINANPKEHYF